MRILFSPAGDSDPVRSFRDGGMLHILRCYGPFDLVYVYLTADMEKKEKDGHIYSKGIRSVSETCQIEWIESGVTEPHKYSCLASLQAAFYEGYNQHPDGEWYLNLSPGTPQIKTIMALIGLDHPKAHAIQVASPQEGSNRYEHPNGDKEDMIAMIEMNEDAEPEGFVNRCEAEDFLLLKKHSLAEQLKSLIRNYEYSGAVRLLKGYEDLFPETAQRLIRHGEYRSRLMWKSANTVIARYNGKSLLPSPDDFSEYFQGMEMRQRKGELPEFLAKLSPVLTYLGEAYVKKIACFDISACGEKRKDGVLWLDRETIQKYDGQFLRFLDGELGNFRSGPLNFNTIVYLCDYLRQTRLKEDEAHGRITHLFTLLRKVEKELRNPVAHDIVNITENDIIEKASIPGERIGSKELLNYLHEAVRLVRGKDVTWTYDMLNGKIIENL